MNLVINRIRLKRLKFKENMFSLTETFRNHKRKIFTAVLGKESTILYNFIYAYLYWISEGGTWEKKFAGMCVGFSTFKLVKIKYVEFAFARLKHMAKLFSIFFKLPWHPIQGLIRVPLSKGQG